MFGYLNAPKYSYHAYIKDAWFSLIIGKVCFNSRRLNPPLALKWFQRGRGGSTLTDRTGPGEKVQPGGQGVLKLDLDKEGHFRPRVFRVCLHAVVSFLIFQISRANRIACPTSIILFLDNVAIREPIFPLGTVCRWSQFIAQSRGIPSD